MCREIVSYLLNKHQYLPLVLPVFLLSIVSTPNMGGVGGVIQVMPVCLYAFEFMYGSCRSELISI